MSYTLICFKCPKALNYTEKVKKKQSFYSLSPTFFILFLFKLSYMKHFSKLWTNREK